MSITMPTPIDQFVRAMNAHDTEELLASLSEDALIADEGQELRGRDQIKEWSDRINREYHVAVDVSDVAQQDGETVVTTLVSGTFDGSPLQFRYHFVLERDKIAALRIED